MSAIVALLLVFILPSAAGAVALAGPSRDSADGAPDASPDVLLVRGLACGIAAWLLGSGLLTRVDRLSTAASWWWDAAVAVASLIVLLLPANRSRIRRVLAIVGLRVGESAGLSAIVYVPLAFVILKTSWSPLGSTPWYYYGLARQVAEAGSIPSTSLEFATATPFLNDYHLYTTGTAMLLDQHGTGPITVTAIITVLGALLLGVGAVAVTSALGAGRLVALLAAPIAVASGIAPIRMAAYRPEGMGLALALLVVALSIDWLRRRDWRSLVTAAVLAAVLSQVHGVAAVTTGVLISAAAITFFLTGPRREQLWRTGIALVSLLGAVVVTGLVFKEASGTVHAGGLVDSGGLADPTWRFYEEARDHAPSLPPSNASMVSDSIRELYTWSWWWAVPVILLAVYGLWRRRRETVPHEVIVFSVLSLVGLAVVASVFMFAWQGYVPRRTGASRLVLEASLLVPTFVAIGLSCLGRELLRRRRLTQRVRPLAAGALAAITVFGFVSLIGVSSYDSAQAPSQAELAAWRSLPLTSKDVVLANGYTEGFIPDLTSAQGLLDGRAPYTFGSLLHRSDTLFNGAQAFYANPAANWSFLARNHVTWVVVGASDAYSLGTGNVWAKPHSLRGLQGCRGLQQVLNDKTLAVFRVVDPGPDGCTGAR